MKEKMIIAVCGPTASGKTGLAIELAKEFNGEIISCDSMQIYRGMDIGSAKPDADELKAVKHHLIDVCDVWDNFSCADYKTLAQKAEQEIIAKGKLPIYCGGTGFYLDAVVSNNVFSPCPTDEEYRNKLFEIDNDTLHRMLAEVDKESAEAIHKNNKKRVIRALEIYHLTGKTKSMWDSESRQSSFDPTFICLMPDWERDILYERINSRVDYMISNGLIEEAKMLRDKSGPTALQAIGYKELYDYFDGKCDLSSAVESIKTATRNYAKRQLTWFRHRDYIIPIELKKEDDIASMKQKAIEYITDRGFFE